MWAGESRRGYVASYVPGAFDYYISPTGSDANPGTLASPWAITTLTESSANWTTISAKAAASGCRIGLLDGTYDVSSFGNQASGLPVRLRTPPGASLAQPFYLGPAQTMRGPVITAKSGSTYPGTAAIIGAGGSGVMGIACSYVTLYGLTITGCQSDGVSYSGVGAGDNAGLIVDSCHIYDIQSATPANNVAGIMWGQIGVIGALVNNCKIHDCYVNPPSWASGATYTGSIPSAPVYATYSGNIYIMTYPWQSGTTYPAAPIVHRNDAAGFVYVTYNGNIYQSAAGSNLGNTPSGTSASTAWWTYIQAVGGGNVNQTPSGTTADNAWWHFFYDDATYFNSHSNCSCIHDLGKDTTVQGCTFYNAHNHIYQKNAAATVPPQGMTAKYNYFYKGSTGTGTALAGFNNATGTTPPYDPTNIVNNVFENVPLLDTSNSAPNAFQADWNFESNTYYCPSVTNPQIGPFVSYNPSLTTLRFFNNVIDNGNVQSTGGGSGAFFFGGGTPQGGASTTTWWTIIDFNNYYLQFGGTYSGVGLSNSNHTTPTTFYTSLANWRSNSTTYGPAADANTTQVLPVYSAGTPTAGGGAAQYKLVSGGGKGSGSVTGLAGGAACDMGAWGGSSAPSQIGCNF